MTPPPPAQAAAQTQRSTCLAALAKNKEDEDKQNASPALRTCNKSLPAVEEAMLSCFDVGHHKMPGCILVSQKFPQEVLTAVLNEETGELVEYCHLIGNPKYRELWQHSYGNEVGQLY